MRLYKPSLALPAAVLLVAAGHAAPQQARRVAARAAEPTPATVAPTMAGVVQVNTGRGRLVTLSRPMSDLFVADPAIADVQVRSPTQLYIFGKKTGETTVSATTKSGQVVFAATVRIGNNLDSVGQMLHLAMPEAKIVATPMNGLVLLTGTVATPADVAEAERLVQAFVGDQTKVISRLRTATPLQVNLHVKIAEVSRSFAKNIGANLASVDQTGGFKFGIGRGRDNFSTQFSPGGPVGTNFTEAPAGGSQITKATTGATLGLAGRLLGLDLIGALDLGETLGQVSTLAEPNVTALSGETSSFLAGGEIPIPLSQGLGAVSVEYKQYGVSLAYTPTVLSDGRISLRVRPEVSQLTSAGAVQINGTTIPALTTRRVETTVELGSGQSMMIGGLLSNNHNNNIDKTPGLGDLPVLGSLFRSNSWSRNETELVIIITPYLVKPVNNAADIKLPTDGYRSATDLGRVFFGLNEGVGSGGPRPVPTMAQPTAASPTIGATAPVLPVPAPVMPITQPRRETAAPAPKKGSALPTPGFSE